MNIDEIINLFEEIETGNTGQLIGYHLHKPIRQATEQHWETNQNYKPTFSGFLKALKDVKPTGPTQIPV